jgi:Protein of unknown function (DUF3089)
MSMRFFLYLIIVSIGLFSCKAGYKAYIGNYKFISTNQLPNYSSLDYWAAHPNKKDPSDSVPKNLKANNKVDTTVDVFFLHPTTYTDKEKALGWNAAIDDAELNAKTDYSSILYQASVFNNTANIFAPRYRQANLYAYYPVTKQDTIQALAAFDMAYTDIKTAFEYYLANNNNGKPIIIAAHSQGTTHAKRLIKEFFDGKPLQNKLVVAYLVGMPIEPDFFASLKPCTTPKQTGCLCSWRTFKEGYISDFAKQEQYVAIVTNPLTWDSLQPTTTRFDNKGSVLKNFKKLVPHVTNASVEGGVLWAKHPKFFGSFLLKTKNYHIADFNFYYFSIRENAANRVQAFWKK